MVQTLGHAPEGAGVKERKGIADGKRGKTPASQVEQHQKLTEPAEVNRAYPDLMNSRETQVDGADAAGDEPRKTTPNAYLLALQAEKKGLEKHLDLVTNERDELRRRLDEEAEERRRLITVLVDQHQKSWLQRIGLRR